MPKKTAAKQKKSPRTSGAVKPKPARTRAVRRKAAPPKAKPGVYAVTGCSGYIGRSLLRRLAARNDVRRIVGLDIAAPAFTHPKFTFIKADVRDPALTEKLARARVDALIHLAFIVDPFYDEVEMHVINVEGTENVLAAAHELGLKHLIVFSSTTAYGAHADNPVPLPESAPTRANAEFRYGADKAEIDEMTRRFAALHPRMRVNIVRPCIVLGPDVANYIAAQFLLFPVMPLVNGRNPPLQFVHDEDVIELTMRLVDHPVHGAFNCVGTGVVTMRQMAQIMGKHTVFMPSIVLRLLLVAAWRSRLIPQGVPPGILPYYEHPWVADGARARRELGFIPRHASDEAFHAMYDRRDAIVRGIVEKFRRRGRR